jgi:hypothetical protein
MISIPIARPIEDRKPRRAFPTSSMSAPPMRQIVKARM